VIIVSAAQLRAHIARILLGNRTHAATTLGSITLRSHQASAAARLYAVIEKFGGALLAEPVGLGKTYTALAVAARFGPPLTIVIPSALREMWRDALSRSAMSATLVTHEALSRGATLELTSGFVIVDEAHRVRSPNTHRYAQLAEFCRRAHVLLVSATPLQNRRTDLTAQLALFLGRRAWQLSDDELAQYIVRSNGEATTDLPSLSGPHRIELTTHDDCVDQIVALPAPVPAEDESVAVALLTYSLIHQWISSRAALIAALDRRRARGLSLLAALEAGTRPTRAELSAWTHAGDAVQLAFPELVVTPSNVDSDLGALAIAVDRHNSGVHALIHRLRTSPDPDDERAARLREIRARHPGERIIAFCHYTETVNALRSKLSRDPGIATLTAHGARLASGRVSRETVLRQFTPNTMGTTHVVAAEQIDLLLTTDLLSEGLNLQEASVVVHLDLPWNPARLEQRVGRVRRIGSRFDTVTVYAIAPPISAERLIRIEQRLRDKLNVAQRTVGIAGRILPSPLAFSHCQVGIAEQAGAVDRLIHGWSDDDEDSIIRTSNLTESFVASVRAPFDGFLALVDDGDEPHLVADVGGGISRSPSTIVRALEAANQPETAPRDAEVRATVARLNTWLDAQRGAATVDLTIAAAARFRRTTLARVSRALERTPRHRRAQLAPLADAARAVATAPLAEGAERILEMLSKSELPDEAWLRSIATFAALNGRPPTHTHRAEDHALIARSDARIACLLLFEITPL
jgi:superfamily II DNA or RNA helicase